MSARIPIRAALLALAVCVAAAPLLAQADRSKPPKPGPVRSLKLPAVERLSLSNGMSVLLVGVHEVPVVEVVLVVRAGATADPVGREGTAAMTADLLDEGAGGKDALALADAIDFLGATIGAGASWDASTVRLRVPVARLDDALALMADVALRPDFPEAELERLRKEALTDLLQARDVPSAIASRALAQAVFGPAHRYGRPQAGGAAEIASFKVADLKQFHAARYVPSASSLVVVGDVTAAVLPSLEKAFGSWKAQAAARRRRRCRPRASSPPAPSGSSTRRTRRSRRSASAASGRPGPTPRTPRTR